MTLSNNDGERVGAQSRNGGDAPEPTDGTPSQAPAAAGERPDGRPAGAPAAEGCDPDVLIDPEFRSLIPPHTGEERALLKEKLSREGCRDPLVVRKGRRVVLDGMTRLELCRELGVPYTTASVDLPSREAAKDWVITTQLGRRNLTRLAASYLRGRRYNGLKGPHGGGRNRGKSSPQTDHSKTAEALAAEYASSASTIQRDGQLAEAVDRIGAVLGEEVKRSILSGRYAMTQTAAVGLAGESAAVMEDRLRLLEEGRTSEKAGGAGRQRQGRQEGPRGRGPARQGRRAGGGRPGRRRAPRHGR
jgi:hypothetical protein